MADSRSYMGGLIAAIVGILITLMLFYIAALPAERTVDIFEGLNVYDVPEQWASYDNVSFFMSLMYVAIMSPALVGLITLFLSAIRTQDYDVVTDEEQTQQYYSGYYPGR